MKFSLVTSSRFQKVSLCLYPVSFRLQFLCLLIITSSNCRGLDCPAAISYLLTAEQTAIFAGLLLVSCLAVCTFTELFSMWNLTRIEVQLCNMLSPEAPRLSLAYYQWGLVSILTPFGILVDIFGLCFFWIFSETNFLSCITTILTFRWIVGLVLLVTFSLVDISFKLVKEHCIVCCGRNFWWNLFSFQKSSTKHWFKIWS